MLPLHRHSDNLISGLVCSIRKWGCFPLYVSQYFPLGHPSFSPALQCEWPELWQKEITFLPRPLPPPHILCSSTFWNNFYEFFVLSEGEEPGMVRQGPVPGAWGKGHGWCLRTSVCDVSVWEQFSYSELLHAFGSFKIWPQGISIQITRTCQKKSRNRQIQVHIDTCSSSLQTKVPRWLHKEKSIFNKCYCSYGISAICLEERWTWTWPYTIQKINSK